MRARKKVSQSRWEYINRVVATPTESRTRFKPGVAVSIIRECLAGLAALHREEIVHGDIKPSNIMVKRTGNAKLIDIGSAIDLNDMPQMKTCTPQYAAPEMLDREEITPRSRLVQPGLRAGRAAGRCAAVRGHQGVRRSCSKPSGRCRNGCTKCCRRRSRTASC